MNEINVIEEKFSRCPKCRSFSVKQTEINLIEKFRSHFTPVSAFACTNCRYRGAIYGRFSVSYKKNWLVVTIPLVLVAILVGVFMLSGGPKTDAPQDTKPDVTDTAPPVETADPAPDKTPETKPAETSGQTPDETPDPTANQTPPPEDQQTTPPEDQQTPPQGDQQTEPPEDQSETVPEMVITGEIILGDSNRFGVNWTPVSNGVRITRLSNGPLKRAGLQVGDVLSEVDGDRIRTGNSLLRIRNDIFRGRREEGIIKVYRDSQTLYFRMVKVRKETAEKTTAAGATVPIPIKVFAASSVKVRKSSPDRVNPANRWRFISRNITINRESHQRVYVAGDPSGDARWGVDDKLIINDKAFDGILEEYDDHTGFLPERVHRPPLDITELVPSGREMRISIALADHGRFWANTDIYVVVK